MRETLWALAARGVVEDIAVAFSEFIGRLDPTQNSLVMLAACWVSHRTTQGHTCVDLSEAAERILFTQGELSITAPSLAIWERALRDSTLVGTPGEHLPLILDNAHRFYLYRYWDYENRLYTRVIDRSTGMIAGIDQSHLRQVIEEAFGQRPSLSPDWQRVAVAVAVLKRFCIIAGGPGTGKTSTVVRVLVALARLYCEKKLRIIVTAPTGKAAARVTEAIRFATIKLTDSSMNAIDIPEEAFTLHRVLGVRPDTGEFRYHAHNPLPADVVIIDEASMVDLALMSKLVDALAADTRLILVGDRDQLASVEAGAVLADLCNGSGGFSPEFAVVLRHVTGQVIPFDEPARAPLGALGALSDSVVVLGHSHRFDAESGIGKLARYVNQGEVRQVLETLANSHDDIAWFTHATRDELLTRIVQGYAAYRQAVNERADPAEVFKAFNRFRVLCAVRMGPFGVDEMNRRIEHALWSTRVRSASSWYAGRPVIILRNDYSTALFNGDVGIALPSREDGGPLRVYFPSSNGFRGIHPARLPQYETVYAMTVHKSQGSEFDEVFLLLSEGESKVLSRELFYTAITRARRRFDLCASAERVKSAVERRVTRVSGLAAKWRREEV